MKFNKIVLCVVTLFFSLQFAYAAQITIEGTTYRFNKNHTQNRNLQRPFKWNKGEKVMTAAKLQRYLEAMRKHIKTRSYILMELGRILLAQTGNKHNVDTNILPKYAIDNKNDIRLACDELHDHLLIHGHLGYYPNISFIPDNDPNQRIQQKVNKNEARGIFNINGAVAQRVFTAQPLDYLAPITNIGYAIDKPSKSIPITLSDIADELINTIFSTNKINNVEIRKASLNRFTIEFDYTGGTIQKETRRYIYNITNGPFIGYGFTSNIENRTGSKLTLTNRIKIVVEVNDGIVRIVTMYPV